MKQQQRILLLNGLDFIGFHLVQTWLEAYPNHIFYIWDSISTDVYLTELEPFIVNEQVVVVDDVTSQSGNFTAIFDSVQFDKILQIVSDLAENAYAYQLFVSQQTKAVLNTARADWACREDKQFILVHTDQVFRDFDQVYASDSDAETRTAETVLKDLAGELEIKYYTTNCTNLYGLKQNKDRLIPYIIQRLLTKVSFRIPQDSATIRDWLHIEDYAKGILLVVEKGKAKQNYNFVGLSEWSLYDLSCFIIQKFDELRGNTFSASQDLLLHKNGLRFKSLKTRLNSNMTIDELGYVPSKNFCDHLDFIMQSEIVKTK